MVLRSQGAARNAGARLLRRAAAVRRRVAGRHGADGGVDGDLLLRIRRRLVEGEADVVGLAVEQEGRALDDQGVVGVGGRAAKAKRVDSKVARAKIKATRGRFRDDE